MDFFVAMGMRGVSRRTRACDDDALGAEMDGDFVGWVRRGEDEERVISVGLSLAAFALAGSTRVSVFATGCRETESAAFELSTGFSGLVGLGLV